MHDSTAQPRTAPLSREVVDAALASIDADAPRLLEIFRDIHRHPELGFSEHRTAGIVAAALEGLGFEVTTGIGGTGVLAILRNGEGPTVMYRADMDANAVEEATGLDYASTARATREDGSETPVAHMCGHDAHVTWLIGMATAVVGLRDRWKGTLVLIGQPAEELGLGARAMAEDGLYGRHGAPRPDVYVGQHTAPTPVGRHAVVGGEAMAGCDQVDVTFTGRGTHGSMPHLSIDPVVLAATAVLQYQTIVSRSVSPLERAVVTVGALHTGTDNNVIPSEATLRLNLRWYNQETRELLHRRLDEINRGLVLAAGLGEGAVPELRFKGGATPVVNDVALATRIADAQAATFGEEGLVRAQAPSTGSEDMPQVLGPHADIPYVYSFVGVADPDVFAAALAEGKDAPYAYHQPDYVVDLAAVPHGAKTAAVTVLELLGRG